MLCIDLNEDITLEFSATGSLLPFVGKYQPSLCWLLDIATDAVPEQRVVVERLRDVVRQLVAGRCVWIYTRDVKIVLAILLEALECDLGPVVSRPPLAFPKITGDARTSRSRSKDTPISLVGNVEWGLALGAGDWIPLFDRHHAALEWLLDVAHGATKDLTDSRQRAAVARVRSAFRRLARHVNSDASAFVDLADLRCVVTLVLVAMERDLGPVGQRPRRRFRMPTAAEAFGAGMAELFRAIGKQVGKAVAP